MFVNKTYSSPIEKTLEESPFQFYITGSNYFGGRTEKSDSDFFTKDSAEVRKFLLENGFDEDFSHSYNDHGNVIVFTGYSLGGNIHVQCVKNAELKNQAQVLIDESGLYMAAIPKESRKYIWDLAMSIISRFGGVKELKRMVSV